MAVVCIKLEELEEAKALIDKELMQQNKKRGLMQNYTCF